MQGYVNIGVTGGIGSGKSAVLHEVESMGYAVYYSDIEAKRLIETNNDVRTQIGALLGADVFSEGVYQTAVVAKRVFANRALLEALNAIVHPAVLNDYLCWRKAFKISFVESAILYESGLAAYCDSVVAISAPTEVRVQRAIHRAALQGQSINRAQVEARIASQSGVSLHRADMTLLNDGSIPLNELGNQMVEYALSLADE